MEEVSKKNVTSTKIRVLNSILEFKNILFIYLVKVDSSKMSKHLNLPVGETVKKINNKSIKNFNELTEISKVDSIEFCNGEKYFIEEKEGNIGTSSNINELSDEEQRKILNILQNLRKLK